MVDALTSNDTRARPITVVCGPHQHSSYDSASNAHFHTVYEGHCNIVSLFLSDIVFKLYSYTQFFDVEVAVEASRTKGFHRAVL